MFSCRVHDNAQANAVMQKAITILNIEESMGLKRRKKFRTFIHTNCAPEEDFYDDDTTSPAGEDLKKVTIQIKVISSGSLRVPDILLSFLVLYKVTFSHPHVI